MFRQRSAAVVQGFRTRDAAFRVFRNEKLERYKALQDMASKYTFLAAQAYDYETGLLGTDEGRKFINRIISSRALGVVVDGQPQFAGSNTGDPGISSVLAEMKNEWDVLKGRLGFNNPDQYSTTVSLRSEKHRILPGQDGALQWGDVLEGARSQNVMTDNDVRRYCMHAGFEDARPVPGLIIEFSTTIEKEKNLFGLPLAGGDSQFSPASFATKIFSVGVALEGYIGMGARIPTTKVVNPVKPNAAVAGSQRALQDAVCLSHSSRGGLHAEPAARRHKPNSKLVRSGRGDPAAFQHR